MTPVEKAQELYDKFEDVMIDADAYFVESGGYRAAIKAVEQILKENKTPEISHRIDSYKTAQDFNNNWTHIKDQIDYFTLNQYSYWQQVKQELEYMRTKHFDK
jgi:hypothetical protein